MSIKVLNMAGNQVGEVELKSEIFGIEPNMHVVHEVVKNHLANCRQGTQSALTRAEVSGGGKKPWRQKGTGHLNKKVRRLALKSVLSAKASEGKIIVVDSIAMDSIKTKAFRGFLDAVNCDGKAVVITPEVNENVVKSARNIPGVLTTTARILSVYDILNAKYLVIDQAALATIEEVYA